MAGRRASSISRSKTHRLARITFPDDVSLPGGMGSQVIDRGSSTRLDANTNTDALRTTRTRASNLRYGPQTRGYIGAETVDSDSA